MGSEGPHVPPGAHVHLLNDYPLIRSHGAICALGGGETVLSLRNLWRAKTGLPLPASMGISKVCVLIYMEHIAPRGCEQDGGPPMEPVLPTLLQGPGQRVTLFPGMGSEGRQKALGKQCRYRLVGLGLVDPELVEVRDLCRRQAVSATIPTASYRAWH